MRFAILILFATLLQSAAFAGDNTYVMNFDLNRLSPSGEIEGSIQLQGIHLSPEKPFHGKDLGRFDYFLTASEADNGEAKLTIEFYEYESRRKTSGVISEIVAEVDIEFGNPAKFEGKTDTFGIDLAFNINEK